MSNHNKFHTHLPRNTQESIFFMLIVSVISVNIIAPLISFSEIGFSAEVYFHTLQILPFIWCAVIPTVLITQKPTSILVSKIMKDGDSFSSAMVINALINVFLMSIILTIVGSWIGEGSISAEPIQHFLMKWPRNFAIAFAVELLIAQPIARHIISKIHTKKD